MISAPLRIGYGIGDHRGQTAVSGLAAQSILPVLCVVLCWSFFPTSASAQMPVVLDSVVAVVNRQPILASDIDEEIRLDVLDPGHVDQNNFTRQRALERLIGRALIQQQIRREDAQAVEPSADDVNTRIAEMRRELPACVRANCSSDAGWQAFLAAHDLTPQRVEAYLRNRLEILGFIEERFRPGIHIPPQDVEAYYRNTLVPQYPAGQAAPPLDKVAPRIEEILLQQQVNVLFDEWLENLRKQGDVEILDPALQGASAPRQPQDSKEKASQ